MSKLLCDCGHVIVDQTDALPYKARFLPDQDEERFWDDLVETCARLAEMTAAERRDWAARTLGATLPDDVPLADLFSMATARLRAEGRDMYECAACGTLWLVPPGGTGRLLAYTPSEPRPRGVLRGTGG